MFVLEAINSHSMRTDVYMHVPSAFPKFMLRLHLQIVHILISIEPRIHVSLGCVAQVLILHEFIVRRVFSENVYTLCDFQLFQCFH